MPVPWILWALDTISFSWDTISWYRFILIFLNSSSESTTGKLLGFFSGPLKLMMSTDLTATPRITGNPASYRGVWMCFSQGSGISSPHQWLEIPWFLHPRKLTWNLKIIPLKRNSSSTPSLLGSMLVFGGVDYLFSRYRLGGFECIPNGWNPPKKCSFKGVNISGGPGG